MLSQKHLDKYMDRIGLEQWFLTILAPVRTYVNKILYVVCTFVRFLNMVPKIDMLFVSPS